MDLLTRIQKWYTLNCNGDWEHSYGLSVWHGISVTTLDNPGWIVKIDLAETCLQGATLPQTSINRSSSDWVSFEIDKMSFNGYGGPENLTEILSYFLDTLLPSQADKAFEIDLNLPIAEYPDLVWLKAKAYMKSEDTLVLTSIDDANLPNSYEWLTDAGMALLNPKSFAISNPTITFRIGEELTAKVVGGEDTYRVILVGQPRPPSF